MSGQGICLQAYLPMRREPDERSELISQVLYGECFTILESSSEGNYSKVQLDFDQYTGWICSRAIYSLSDKEKELILSGEKLITSKPYTSLQSKENPACLMIGCGSTIYMKGKKMIDLTDNNYFFKESTFYKQDQNPNQFLVESGLKLLNIPYLWGGTSSFGFDCSGLCQNLYRQIGKVLPRDSQPQSLSGKAVVFPDDVKPGDLAFFENEYGKIIHVGMLIDQNRILHASGKVRIDRIDHHGIFSVEENRYTHRIRFVKRIID